MAIDAVAILAERRRRVHCIVFDSINCDEKPSPRA